MTKKDGSFSDITGCEMTFILKASAEGYLDAERKIVIGGQRNKKNDASLSLVSLASINKKEQEERQREIQKQLRIEQEKQDKAIENLKIGEQKKKKQFEKTIASKPHIK